MDIEKPVFKIDQSKKVRFISLFSGIGFQELGLKYLGVNFEYYRAVEFDKYAVEAYNAVHGTDIKVTDVTTVKGEDLGIVDKDKYTYLLTYSFPCFTGDTLVLTDEGFKEIRDVKIGDKVLTHSNTFEKVLDSRKTGTKNIYKISCMSADEIRCTENHKFYVRGMYRKGHKGVRTFKEPEWKECKDLTKKDYLGIAINTKSEIPQWNGIEIQWDDRDRVENHNKISSLLNNDSFWWLMGYYLGDGWERVQGGIVLAASDKKLKKLIPHISNCGFGYNIVNERTCKKVHIPLKELGAYVTIFGKYAYGKYVPKEVLNLPCPLLKSFLDGYFAADGCFTGGVYKATSVSRKLIYGIGQCVAKVYKTPFSIYKNVRAKTCIIEGRTVNQRTSYEISYKTEKRKQDKAFYENGYIWFPINKIINENQEEDVFDITVENEHSFTANGVIVHNCTDLSVAGLQKGMEEGSGTRSSLLWEVRRLLDETKELPDVLIMENVTAVHGTKNKASFDKWIKYLESKGYSNYWQDMNCLDYGVPQSRNRCFMVSILGNYLFEFPKPIELEYDMEDLLVNEDKVARKFYYNSDKTHKLVQDMLDKGELPYAENNVSN